MPAFGCFRPKLGALSVGWIDEPTLAMRLWELARPDAREADGRGRVANPFREGPRGLLLGLGGERTAARARSRLARERRGARRRFPRGDRPSLARGASALRRAVVARRPDGRELLRGDVRPLPAFERDAPAWLDRRRLRGGARAGRRAGVPRGASAHTAQGRSGGRCRRVLRRSWLPRGSGSMPRSIRRWLSSRPSSGSRRGRRSSPRPRSPPGRR